MAAGLKTLLETYWGAGGWRHQAPDARALAQAKAEGCMFGPVPERSHDETLQALRDVLGGSPRRTWRTRSSSA